MLSFCSSYTNGNVFLRFEAEGKMKMKQKISDGITFAR